MALLKNSSLKGRLQHGYLLYWRNQNALIRPRLVKITVMGKHKPQPGFAASQDVLLLIGLADNRSRAFRPSWLVLAKRNVLEVSDRNTHHAERNLFNNVPLTQVGTRLRGPPRACSAHRIKREAVESRRPVLELDAMRAAQQLRWTSRVRVNPILGVPPRLLCCQRKRLAPQEQRWQLVHGPLR